MLQDVTKTANESTTVERVMFRTVRRVCGGVWPVGRICFVGAGVDAVGAAEIWHWGRPPRSRGYRKRLRAAFPRDHELIEAVTRTGRTRWIEDIPRTGTAPPPARATFAFPVAIPEVVGVGQLFADRPVRRSDEFDDVMVAVGIQLGYAVERWVLHQRVATATVREQQRVGRELHDNVSQQLTGIAMMAEMLNEELAAAGSDKAARMKQLARHVRQAQADVHALARGLMPVEVEAEDGLRHALEQLAETTDRVYGIRCRCTCDAVVPVENSQVATHLYRIAQEAVQNAVKHAEAEYIAIVLAKRGGRLILSVRDDGRGFKRGRRRSSGLGMQLMRHRAGVIAGKLRVQSIVGRGTTVSCSLAAAPRS